MTTHVRQQGVFLACLQVLLALSLVAARATPANKAALEKHYDKFLAKNLARCTTCHLPSEHKNPESLDEFPHNTFGARLRSVRNDVSGKDIAASLGAVAREDSDGDGVPNETELLFGYNPGDANSTPPASDLGNAPTRRAEFEKFLASYRWQPFEPVRRPPLPALEKSTSPIANPIDAFIAAEHRARGLQPRSEANKAVLLRRVYLDLIGLSPRPEELTAFERDTAPDAYEKVVERLLADPRHGERWARHWMDVWRYSDWAGWSGGNQIRDSQPHIWRWRDWIVESVNADKPYSQMIVEMLGGDELAPLDTNTLRATGFLVRNYKMLSREQWLEDTVKHTSQAFLGVIVGCAKCHDHMTDPISQAEYFGMRAIFEPHWVRIDRLPGNTNILELGLARAFDTDTNSPTYFLVRGDERKADTNRVLEPGVPRALGGALEIQPVNLPWKAGNPDRTEHVRRDVLVAADKLVAGARAALAGATNNTEAGKAKWAEFTLSLALAEARREAVAAVLDVERVEDAGRKDSDEWKRAATNAVALQRRATVAEARLKHQQAETAQLEAKKKSESASEKLAMATNGVQQIAEKPDSSLQAKKDAAEKAAKALKDAGKKLAEASQALASVEEKLSAAPDTAYQPRTTEKYPITSTGRRLAFARWVASTNNPLTARVAANQVWLRHFGRGLVETPHDFGRSGKEPSHPQLLDWLAAELMSGGQGANRPWSLKHLHRLIVTSQAYRMASTPDEGNAKIDPDNVYLWRMNSRRAEAEVLRDNLLHVAGELDGTMGGPDIDHTLGLKSKRRSLYLRQAAEKEVEFLKIFDGPSVTECYARHTSVVPQQALALANNELTRELSQSLAKKLTGQSSESPEVFARRAFERILARRPSEEELKLCREFLDTRTQATSAARAREALVTVLFNHNDFLTVR